MKKLLAFLALALLSAPVAAQEAPKAPNANMAGNWDFSFTSPQGAATWRIKFEQKGDTLTGQASTDFGALDVSNGWISGNEMSFTLNLNIQGQALQVNFAGTVKGDTAQGNIDVPGVGIQPFPFTAIKAADAADAAGALSRLLAVAERPRVVRLGAR